MRHFSDTAAGGFRDAFHDARHWSCGRDRSYGNGYCVPWKLLQNVGLEFKVQGSTRNPEPGE